MFMDLFSTLQLLHEVVMSVLITTIYGRWRGTITMSAVVYRGSSDRVHLPCLLFNQKHLNANNTHQRYNISLCCSKIIAY